MKKGYVQSLNPKKTNQTTNVDIKSKILSVDTGGSFNRDRKGVENGERKMKHSDSRNVFNLNNVIIPVTFSAPIGPHLDMFNPHA